MRLRIFDYFGIIHRKYKYIIAKKSGKNMRYSIQKISLYGEDIIKNSLRGSVHSAYKKAVNLFLNNRLLSLQPAGSPMSPVSLITDISGKRFEELEIETDDGVIIESNMIIINSRAHSSGEYRFSFSEAMTADLHLSKYLIPIKIRTLSEELSSALSKGVQDGFRGILFSLKESENALVDTVAKEWIEKAKVALEGQNWVIGADSLSRLIGLGIGLTPGGDDFLCGILAGLALCNFTTHSFTGHLRERILSGLDKTNDISREFLQCALDNQYAVAIHQLYSASAEEIINEMGQIGHSSGIDTLCGIQFIFLIREKLAG